MSFLKANFWFRIGLQTNGNIQTWQSVLFSESFSSDENTFVPSSRMENIFILNNLELRMEIKRAKWSLLFSVMVQFTFRSKPQAWYLNQVSILWKSIGLETDWMIVWYEGFTLTLISLLLDIITLFSTPSIGNETLSLH